MDNSEKVVYEFMKNAGEKIKFGLYKFMNRHVIAIRIYFSAGSGKQDWRPTSKKITTVVHNLPELKKGIDLAYKCGSKIKERQK